jgi:ABC-type multidrug transport system fused ATPase/permease subunit
MLRLIARTERRRLLPNDRHLVNRSYQNGLTGTTPYSSSKRDTYQVSFRSFASIQSEASSQDEPETKKPIRDSQDAFVRLGQLSKPEWTLIGLSAATLGVTSSVTLLLPFASGQVIDYTIQNADGGLPPMVLASGLFGLSALAGGGVYLRGIWLARAGNRIVARLKQRLYGSILQQDNAFLDQQTTGDLLSRLTADAQLVQSALTVQSVSGLRALVMSTGSAGMLLYTSPILAAVSCCTLPPIFIFSRQVGRQLQVQQERVQELQGEATSLAEQSLSSISTVKQFVAEDFETVRYQNAISKAHTKAVETAHKQAQLEAGAHVAGNAAILGVLGYGGSLVLDGSISAGDLTGFVMYSLLMAGNLSGLTSVYVEMVRAVAASNRVFDILDRTPKIHGTSLTALDTNHDPLVPVDYQDTLDMTSATRQAASSTQIQVSIQVKGLNFSYPSRPDVNVLKDFDLTVAPGELVALVGSSGSGKSTIAGLLTRLYDADNKDSICIDGKPVSDYEPSELRRMIGIVSQEPTLFRGTIRDNIVYGEWATVSEEQVLEAARLAHVLDFTKHFPKGLETMVGPRGAQLSGGQRQRIALARVLIKNSPIIILDEATSALDAQSEYLVQKAMNSIFHEGGRTIISIAHRLSTIRHSSRIAVIEHGSVVQTGTFDELRSKEGPFRELMKTQLVGQIDA